MRVLYFDCQAGAAGDMILGALLDAGAPEDMVRASLDALALEGWSLQVEPVRRGGLHGLKVGVTAGGDQPERRYSDIKSLIESAGMNERVKRHALDVFDRLAIAEARVHGLDVEEVHFHEVGAMDSIIDIVGACAALEYFSPDRVYTSLIAAGSGASIDTSHGPVPLPGPAVLEILKEAGAPVEGGGPHELLTPTGAALLAAFTHEFVDEMPRMRLVGVGSGAGSAEREHPNVTRVIVGEGGGSGHIVLEANVDDMSPELLPPVIDALLQAGAQDAWLAPITMKKGRPAFTVGALCKADDKAAVETTLFTHTTTLGIRAHTVDKSELDRRWIEVQVSGHPVRVKIGSREGRTLSISPEYEDAVTVSRISQSALRYVFEDATRAARDLLADEERS